MRSGNDVAIVHVAISSWPQNASSVGVSILDGTGQAIRSAINCVIASGDLTCDSSFTSGSLDTVARVASIGLHSPDTPDNVEAGQSFTARIRVTLDTAGEESGAVALEATRNIVAKKDNCGTNYSLGLFKFDLGPHLKK